MATDSVFVANAVGVWKGTLERADKFFNSLREEELQYRVAPDRNRLIYLWGHLTAMHDRMSVLLGVGERIAPAFDEVFLTSADGASGLPPVEEVRKAWKLVSDQLSAGITRLSPDEWLEKHTSVKDEDYAKDPLRNKLSILLTRTNHLSYHLGQTSLVQR
ncbi:DinB family protein [Granulicella arctica]|uniref:DinB family protein n=1 Tax=Granulicella arctica TaxID=940613 RepID=UPI0021E06B3F|nr:DinB family protein [Granulicella arctica]